ncbi:MAG: DnaJ domain-containing protein [Cyanobacteriota bacterium]|nr:DnaJ domain-containing protein [Cyanobacteriota bacterium]
MSFEFDDGLFKFDFTDHNALLGVPIDAEFNDIRKRYMRIARRLHPDTCPFETDEKKELANQLLSKLVSPAYDKFSKESSRAEYFVVLAKLQKRLAQDKNKVKFSSEAAQKVAASGNYQEAYNTAVSELAKEQYETLDRTLEIIGEISELNLAYLVRKQSKSGASAPAASPAAATAAKSSPTERRKAAAPARQSSRSALLEQACDRAESLIASKNYSKATLELKEAIKQDQSHSRSYALLAFCYLQQNQATMAKIQAKKALSLNPKEAKALEVQKFLEKAGSQAKKGKSDKGDKKGSGFLSGLFGGGKKK